jgi:hypothetical protein
MPVVIRYKGYRFFFFSNEGNPQEPLHIHVRNGGDLAKYWIEPDIELAENYGMTPVELRELLNVVKENRELIARKWHEYFNS